MRDLTHVDLFSGPGGFCTGLRAAGFRTATAVEVEANAAATYAANHPEAALIRADVRNVTGWDLIRRLPRRGVFREPDLLTAGACCQTFSTAGPTSRTRYDHRQLLFREAV